MIISHVFMKIANLNGVVNMKVTILGICANQTDTNEGVSLLIETDIRILVDAGPGVVRQILRANRKCTEIEHVIITHSHGDHTLGFPYFIWNHFYEGLEGFKGPEVIHVYTLPQMIEGLQNMMKFCYGPSNYPFKVQYHEVSDKESGEIKIGNTVLRTIPVDHTVPNFGVRIDWNGKCISYSSDTIYSELFKDMAHGSDLLIHEGFVTEELIELSRKVKHGTAKDAGKVAHESNSKELALVHIFPPFMERIDDLILEAKKEFDGNIFVPEELMVINV